MSHGEIEKINAGAEDLNQLDQKIQREVEAEFPYLTPEARRAIIRSRLLIISPPAEKPVRVDLGENASKKAKDNLFE